MDGKNTAISNYIETFWNMAKVKTITFRKLSLASSILIMSISHLLCHTHMFKRMPLLFYKWYNFTPDCNWQKIARNHLVWKVAILLSRKKNSIWPWFTEIHLITHTKHIPFAYWMKTRTRIRIWSFKLLLFWFQ